MTPWEALEFPKAIRQLPGEALPALCLALKQHMAKTHADARALAAVELTVAVHRVFRNPYDAVLFEDEKWVLAHRLLTGHKPGFLSPLQARALPHPQDFLDACHGPMAPAHALEILEGYRLTKREGKAVVILEEERPISAEGFEVLSQVGATDLPWVVLIVRHEKEGKEDKDAFLSHVALAAFFGSLGFSLWPGVDGGDLGEMEAVLRQAKAALKAVVIHIQLPEKPAEDLAAGAL